MLVEQKAGAFKGEAYYGSFVELGWKTGSRSGRALRKGAGGVYKLRANPTERRKVEGKWYMRNASINKEQEARDVYYDGLSKLIDAEARRSGND